MFRLLIRLAVLLLALLIASGCSSNGGNSVGQVGNSSTPPDARNQNDEPIASTELSPVPGDSFDCNTVTEIPAVECQALVAFYEATDGPNWIENGDWLVTNTPCSWYGITCAGGHVESLALFFNGLKNHLPATLADLSQLRLLDLHNNGISGPIPAEVARLENLEDLELSWNHLEGSFPVELAGLSRLQRLSLNNNNLSGPIPAEVGQLDSLRHLDLSHNQFNSAIPETLGNLSALEALRLSDNQLDGTIPFSLGQLPALSEADLSFNHLTGSAPSALFELPVHMLWGNQLDGTIFAGDSGPQNVNYLGASFSFDSATADSVWSELMAASEPSQGPGPVWASPEHIVFTLVGAEGPQDHNPMGLYVPAEAQIHIYPTAGLNEEAQPIVTALKQILSDQPDLSVYESTAPDIDVLDPHLALLPPSNAQQVFRSQAEYLDFVGGSGVRYLTMLSQGIVPVSNYDLFYTFQGLTDDGTTYVAAYFPVSLPDLPDSPQIDEAEFAALMEDWPGYLEQMATKLDGQVDADFTPDLAAIDSLISSLSVENMTSPPLIEGEGTWPDDGESVDSQPILQWADYAGADRYEVVVVDDDAFPPQAVFSLVTTDTLAPVTPALEPGSYSWTVRALDSNDAVLAELNRSFWVKDAITLIAPAVGATIDGEVTLQWQEYPGAAGYQIIVIDDDAFPPVVVFDETTTETSFVVPTPLEPGSYSWSVWALDSDNKVIAELNSNIVVPPGNE